MTEKASPDDGNVPEEHRDLTISPEMNDSGHPQNHPPSDNVSPEGETTSITDRPERVPLVFALNEKKGRHPRYITFDKALDQYGKMLFPDDWGRLPFWDQMPFRWDPEKSAWVQPRIERVEGGKKKLVLLPVDATENDTALLQRCAQLYARMCHDIKRAVKKSQFAVFGSDPSLARQNLIKNLGVFSDKRIQIFYTGSVRLQVSGRKVRRCRLFVRRQAFNKWILPKIYDGIFSVLKNIIDDNASKKGYHITEKTWDEILQPVFDDCGLDGLRRDLKENVFRKLTKRKGKGRPDKFEEIVWQEYMKVLTDELRAAIARYQANLR